MAYFTVRAVFCGAPDIVEQGGQPQDFQVSPFFFPDPQAQAEDSLGVVPVMASPGAPEKSFRFSFDVFKELLGSGPFLHGG
jgi:hypothetical protein